MKNLSMPTLNTGSVLVYIAFICPIYFSPSPKLTGFLKHGHRKFNYMAKEKVETIIQPTGKKTQPTWVAAFTCPFMWTDMLKSLLI